MIFAVRVSVLGIPTLCYGQCKVRRMMSHIPTLNIATSSQSSAAQPSPAQFCWLMMLGQASESKYPVRLNPPPMLVWPCDPPRSFSTYDCCQKWLLCVSLTTGNQRLAHLVAGELYARVRGRGGWSQNMQIFPNISKYFQDHPPPSDVTSNDLNPGYPNLCFCYWGLTEIEELMNFSWDPAAACIVSCSNLRRPDHV